MASFVPINWTGHLYISVSELCLENALGLLINNTSNFREERIIVRKITATFREQRIIARKFTMNHRAKRIIIRKIARIKTIGVTKMRGNFVEISFQAKCLRKATKSQEFRRSSFALLFHNTVTSPEGPGVEDESGLKGLTSSSSSSSPLRSMSESISDIFEYTNIIFMD